MGNFISQKSALKIIAAYAITMFVACSGNTNQQSDKMANDSTADSSKKMAEEHNDAKFDKSEEKDAQFLVDAANINLAEIKIGELAMTKASAKEVKDLAKMIYDDHIKANNALTDLAKKKNITIPVATDDNANSMYNSLNQKSGYDFDQEFCAKMVDGHKDAIEKFNKASNDANDADIRNWAMTMLTSLRMHLDQAMNCQAKLKGKK
jgi:putative membrane protein